MPSPTLLSFVHQGLVVCLLATGFLLLDLIIFSFEATRLHLSSHRLFDKVLGSILLVDPRAVPFCRAFDNGSNLREVGHLVLTSGFLVMPVWIKNGSHLDHLQVALQLWCQDGPRQVEPFGARIGSFALLLC